MAGAGFRERQPGFAEHLPGAALCPRPPHALPSPSVVPGCDEAKASLLTQVQTAK